MSEFIRADGNALEASASAGGAMARVDELAAKEEIQKAAEYHARADQLTAVANELRREARRHLREADELRGAQKRRS
jgi:hypothetical protein